MSESPTNAHHLLWTRRKWRKGAAGKLRAFWYCKAQIPVGTLHRQIHETIAEIPRPNEALCASALEQLKELDRRRVIRKTDPPKLRLELLICLLDTGDSPTAEALKRELALVEAYYR